MTVTHDTRRSVLYINEFSKLSLMKVKGYESSSSARTIGSLIVYSLRDEFIVKTPFYKIANIHEIEEGNYGVIVGTIEHVDDKAAWFYVSCKHCKTKVKNDDGSRAKTADMILKMDENEFLCTSKTCKSKIIEAEASFLLKIRLQGLVGVITLTMFEKQVKRLINVSAMHLLQKQVKIGDTHGFPATLRDMIGQKIAVKIIVKPNNYGKGIPYYNIAKFTDDKDIIEELERNEQGNSLLEQGDYDDSPDIGQSEVLTNDVVSLKDSITFTGDSTPVSEPFVALGCLDSVAKSKTRRLKSKANESKRKLVDVYDLEDNVSESAINGEGVAVDNVTTCVPHKLLIPKKEK